MFKIKFEEAETQKYNSNYNNNFNIIAIERWSYKNKEGLCKLNQRGLQKNNINNHGQYKEKQKYIFWDQPLKLHEYDFQENL